MRRTFFITVAIILLLSSCSMFRWVDKYDNAYEDRIPKQEMPSITLPPAESTTVPTEESTYVTTEVPTYVTTDEEQTIEEVPLLIEVESIDTPPEEPPAEPQETVTEPSEPAIDETTITVEEIAPEPILAVPTEEEETEPPATDIESKAMTVLEKIFDTSIDGQEPDEAVIDGNVIPKWFVYICSFLFLAILFTLCYIAKQRRLKYRDRS